jgi:hypothetical protein
VEGAGQGLTYRAPEAGGDALAKLGRGAAAERQHQCLFRTEAVPLNSVGDGLDQRRGLPCAWAGQYQQRSATVFDNLSLIAVECRDRRYRAIGPNEADVIHGRHLTTQH